jgi:BirA family biotin operon repressor/biotin-[acetyl-CoA-carboxylase] ligase
MRLDTLVNPFGSPVYYFETLSSTMDGARRLAAEGEGHGTVVAAGFQEAGRGRTAGRHWQADGGKNLFFTIILRYPDYAFIPKALTLRTGLALSLAIEDFAPPLAGMPRVKWPNDIMLPGPAAAGTGAARKAAGILTEGDGETLYVGIGVNVAQTEFPEALRSKAVSLALALGDAAPGAVLSPDAPFRLLEKILSRLYREISPGDDPRGGQPRDGRARWQDRLEERLYMKDKPVSFMAGGADSPRPVEGLLRGIGPDGELLIVPRGESLPRAFVTGELQAY